MLHDILIYTKLNIVDKMNEKTKDSETACWNCKHNEWPFGSCDGCENEEEKFLNFEPVDTKIDD